MKRVRLAACMVAVGLALPSAAVAYVIQETSTGEELRFRALPQKFFISDEGSADISGGAEFDALVRAFESWDAVTDSDARFSDFGAVSMDDGDIYKDGGLPARDRKNLVAWVEQGWIEQPAQIALTYTYFVEATGKILEDDIAMNGVDFTWTAGDAGVATDLESIAAHEIGHALGLGHCDDEFGGPGSSPPECADATMFSTASQGETKKRSLAADDMAAVQHLYPPGCCPHTRTEEALAFFGCSASGRRGGGGPVAAAVLAGAVLTTGLLRRRRRKAGALVAALIALPLAASTADASVARALPLAEMARNAATVVRGTVVYTQAMTLQGGAIVTVTEIEVEDVLAGDAPATISVVEPGGEPGDTGVGLMVSGAARFEMGEEVVLFAETARGAYALRFPDAFRPMGMSQGKLTVVRERSAPARVVRNLSGVSRLVLDPDGGWQPVRGDELDGMALDELVERVVRARHD